MTLKNYHRLLAFIIIRWAETLTLFDTLLDSEITTIIQNYTKWKQLILISSSFTYLDPDPLALTGHGRSVPCPSSCPFWQYSTTSGSASYFVVKLQILEKVSMSFFICFPPNWTARRMQVVRVQSGLFCLCIRHRWPRFRELRCDFDRLPFQDDPSCNLL